MEPKEAHRRKALVHFLDVREPYEFEAGHIDGSQHIPIGQIGLRVTEVPAGQTVVVVCQVGQRSALVADFLKSRGLDAQNLEGGLEAWVGEGFELVPPGPGARVAEGYARRLDGQSLEPD
jgi:rhodanese-related sulfurtransferase